MATVVPQLGHTFENWCPSFQSLADPESIKDPETIRIHRLRASESRESTLVCDFHIFVKAPCWYSLSSHKLDYFEPGFLCDGSTSTESIVQRRAKALAAAAVTVVDMFFFAILQIVQYRRSGLGERGTGARPEQEIPEIT